MSTWPVGQVAVATVRSVKAVRVMYADEGSSLHWVSGGQVRGHLWHADRDVTDVRPLVVLDLAPSEVAEFISDLRDGLGGQLNRRIADQIQEQTRPPKPAEPTGLGAVVKDREKRLWVRLATNPPWFHPEVFDKTWDQLDVVKVLSEGVTS